MRVRLQRGAMALAMVAMMLVLVLVLAPAVAMGDGDPASDALIGENVFYPFSSAVSDHLQAKLNAETAAAGRAHFPIKVALIASPSDLGAIPSLFGRPQVYANFLDEEISFVNTNQPLLVVMPDGYGVRGLDPGASAAVASLRKPAGVSSDDLAQAAIVAVPRLAAAEAGHPIGEVSGGPTTSGSSRLLPALLLAVAAVVAAGAITAVRWRWARAQGPPSSGRRRHRRRAPRGARR